MAVMINTFYGWVLGLVVLTFLGCAGGKENALGVTEACLYMDKASQAPRACLETTFGQDCEAGSLNNGDTVEVVEKCPRTTEVGYIGYCEVDLDGAGKVLQFDYFEPESSKCSGTWVNG